MRPRPPAARRPWRRFALASLAIAIWLAPASTTLANSTTTRSPAIDLFERARTAKQNARTPLLPQTRYTVRKQIESIEPVSWLERYGKVQIRERER